MRIVSPEIVTLSRTFGHSAVNKALAAAFDGHVEDVCLIPESGEVCFVPLGCDAGEDWFDLDVELYPDLAARIAQEIGAVS